MHWTSGHVEVDAVLRRLREDARQVLGPDIAAMYLYGSLALGDFDPQSSDIDFLMVTAKTLKAKQLAALERMHVAVRENGLSAASKLEGSYIPVDAVGRHQADGRYPGMGADWPFEVRGQGPDWIINRHVIREHSSALLGPDPQSLIDPISPDELRQAVIALVPFWTRSLEDPQWLERRNYQAFAILTMCRMLYTIKHGKVATKPVAASWGRETLGDPATSLVDRALEWRYDSQPDDLEETLAFIRSTLTTISAQ